MGRGSLEAQELQHPCGSAHTLPRAGEPSAPTLPHPSLFPGEHPYLAQLPETLEISEKINSCYLLVLF